MNAHELVRELGIPTAPEGHYHNFSARGWLSVNCPTCSPVSEKYRLGVRGRGAYCFTCGRVNLAEALAELSGRPLREIKRLIGGLDDDGPREEKPRGKLVIPEGVGPLLPAHRRYLRGRGFDPDDVVRLWQIQGIGIAADLAWRLFCPITHKGQTVSWTTRAIGPDERRYVSAKPEQESVSHKNVLMGADYCRHGIVVCEGPTKVWSGGPGFAATLGVGYTQAQLHAIAAFPVRAIVFDCDDAGQKRAAELCRALAPFPGRTTNVTLDTASQLDEAKPKEIRQIRRSFLE